MYFHRFGSPIYSETSSYAPNLSRHGSENTVPRDTNQPSYDHGYCARFAASVARPLAHTDSPDSPVSGQMYVPTATSLASLRLARRVAIHALSTRSTNIERAALLYHKRRTHSEPIPIRSTVATVPEFRVAADKNRSRLNCGRNLNETVNRMFRRSPGIRETRDRRSERGQTRIRKRCFRQMLHSRAACSPRTFLRFAVFARSILRVARIFFLPSARYVLSTGERTARVSRSAGVFDFQGNLRFEL